MISTMTISPSSYSRDDESCIATGVSPKCAKVTWDLLPYDIRQHVYSYVRTEEQPDYRKVMRLVFYDVWIYSWVEWMSKAQTPTEKTVVHYLFSEWPYQHDFHRYKWKTPDSVNFKIFVYKLKTAKTGVTVSVDGIKIFRGYIRPQNPFEIKKRYYYRNWMYGLLTDQRCMVISWGNNTKNDV